METAISATVHGDALDDEVVLVDAHLVVAEMRHHLVRVRVGTIRDEVRQHVYLDLRLCVTAAEAGITVLV
jgi:hypothetical protein